MLTKTEANQRIYESKEIVKSYARLNQLQKAEQAIFQQIQSELSDTKMLDIGIGAGRTTVQLAPKVKYYLGVDYSNKMIETCKDRFPDIGQHVSFKVMDARNMEGIENEDFDLILFSFNGIDGLSHKDRILTLKEIKRVGKKNSSFIFSTHNLQGIPKRYSINFKKNPLNIIYQVFSTVLLYGINGTPKKIMQHPFVVINDGVHHFRTKHYYIKPKEQVKQLEDLGFKSIRYFSKDTGKELNLSELDNIKDSWIYFYCKI